MKKYVWVIVFIFVSLNHILHAQSWTTVGGAVAVTNSLLSEGISSITTDKFGNIYATGIIRDSSYNYYVAKWNGSVWGKLPIGNISAPNPFGIGQTIVSDSIGNIYTAGEYTDANGRPIVTKWDGVNWNQLGTGTSGIVSYSGSSIYSLTIDKKGAIYAAGNFKDISGNRYVSKWNGSNWNRLGTVTSALLNNSINTIVTDKSGNVYAAGALSDFSNLRYVVKWDGNVWSKLGTFTANGAISQLSVDESDNLYAVGNFTNTNGKYYVAKWDGTNWSDLGSLNAKYSISSIAISKSGNIYVGGNFFDANYHQYVAKWNGSSWSTLGTGTNTLKSNNGINSIAIDKEGNLFVPGFFADKDNFLYVKKWSGDGILTQLDYDNPKYNFQIHPNPGTGVISLANSEELTLDVYNSIGEIVKTNLVGIGKNMDLSSLLPGVYTFVINGQKTPYSSIKWVKE